MASTPPSAPRLVIVKVLPMSSARASFPARPRSARSWISAGDHRDALRVRVADDGDDEPVGGRRGDADVVARLDDQLRLARRPSYAFSSRVGLEPRHHAP